MNDSKDFLQADVVNRLPNYFRPEDGGDVPIDLIGATIVGFGSLAEPCAVWSGGLVIDYRPQGQEQVIRLVLEAADTGMWAVFRGILPEVPTQASPQGLSAGERA